MTEQDTPDTTGGSFDYESAIGRLEEIVSLLEGNETRLEDAIKLYEEGVELARSCMKRLRDAELHITELKLTDVDSDDQSLVRD
jgi:exodeoxyribonuclease VII small subunit